MTDITAIGEMLIDLTQTGVNEQNIPILAANAGGAPANMTVAAARLGAKCRMIGKVGRDGFGAYLRGVLRENGVEDRYLLQDAEATTMAVVNVDTMGERTFCFVRGADCNLREEEIPPEAVTETKFFHFGSVSLTKEPARTATLAAVQRAKGGGALISYDPNYRDALWTDQETAIHWMCMPLNLVDVLKISQEELPLLTGTTDPDAGTRALTDRGIRLIVLTQGGDGAYCRCGNLTVHVPGIKTPVADTNGAGDTFFGALLSRLCSRKTRLDDISEAELYHSIAFANRAAAITCSRPGAIPAMPTLAEVETLNLKE